MDEVLYFRRSLVGTDQLNYWIDARVYQDRLVGQIVENAFPRSFAKVWRRIPLLDRRHILEYWRQPRRCGMISPNLPPHIPYIRIVDTDLGDVGQIQSTCENSGQNLSFSVSLVMGAPDRLADVIATVLAEVHQWAMFARDRQEHVQCALLLWGFATGFG